MFPPTRYLEWVRRYYGTIRYDLATSGIPAARLEELRSFDSRRPSEPDDWERLRGAIARYNDRPAQEALATLGATHAVWLAYSTLTNPGDEILVEDPAYEPLVRIAQGVGANVTRFQRPSREGFALDPERVARAMTPRTRLVVITNLHNPSGCRDSDTAIRETARLAEARGAIVVVDEVYAPFDGLADRSGVFRATARRLAANVVAVSSLTKCYGLGHERLGWLLGPPDVIARAGDNLTTSTGFLPLAHAHRGVFAFERIDELATRARLDLARKREIVRSWVACRGLPWSDPKDGIFAFVTVPGRGDLIERIEAAAAEREVLVVPGVFFGIPNGFRVAWSKPIATLDEGLARLSEALELAPV
jgi:aspartate/methionine/tyrosine aminotransferase